MNESRIREIVREVAEATVGPIIVADFAAAVAQRAVAEEREACAALMEHLALDEIPRHELANEIRKRGG